MTDAEKLFNETYAGWMYAWSAIHNFRNIFNGVSDIVAERLRAQTESLFRSLIEDPQWKDLLTDQEQFAKSFDRTLVRTSAEALLTAHYGSLDAATLVFFHSVLDAMAFNCCRVTAFHAPQDWEQDLKNTQIPLLDAKSRPYEQLFKLKLDERFEKFERDGLLANMDRLFARCQPPAGWSPMHGYNFDREKIKAFDSQRHEIIHGNAFGKPLTLFGVSDESLYYVSQTAMYLMGLVNRKYGLRIDPKYVGDYLQQRNRTEGSPQSTSAESTHGD